VLDHETVHFHLQSTEKADETKALTCIFVFELRVSKEMFREISKCFGINPLEEVISARRDKFLKRYCALDNLCQLLHDKH